MPGKHRRSTQTKILGRIRDTSTVVVVVVVVAVVAAVVVVVVAAVQLLCCCCCHCYRAGRGQGWHE